MASEYRLLYTNLKTGDILGELPVQDVKFRDGINAAGSMTATIALEDSAVVEVPGAHPSPSASSELTTPQLITSETLRPGASGIYIERDGVILWGGILWTLRMSIASSTAELGAEGYLSWLRRIFIATDLSYSSVDQGAIAKALVDYAVGFAGGQLITATTPPTSTARTRNYVAVERKPVGEALTQLAAVQGGFSFFFTHTRIDDNITTTFELDTDSLGRLTSYVFEAGTNMSLMDVSYDGHNMANYVEVWGQSLGDPRFYGAAFDSVSLVTSPLIAHVETNGDIKLLSTLQERAKQEIRRRASPIERVTAQVFVDAVPQLGAYRVGDRVTVRASYGALSVSGVYRILEISVKVSDTEEIATLTLAPQELF